MRRGHFTAGALAGVAMFGAWQLLTQLSPDAIGMIVGLLFGTLAGVPVTLLLLYGRQQQQGRHTVSAETPPHIIYIERPAIEAAATTVTMHTHRRIVCDLQERR